MKKRWTGYAAAALSASLILSGAAATYGATLTLAGFGADQEVEEKAVQAEATAQPEEAAQTQPEETAAAQQEEEKKAEETGKDTASAKEETSQAEKKAGKEAKAEEKKPAEEAKAEEKKPAEEAKAEEKKPAEEAKAEKAKAEEEKPAEEARAEEQIDRSMVDTTGFAKTEDYVNVRASGDTEGEIVGTLQMNDSVYIEDVDENGWYKVRSGNVEGYVAGYLIATGEEAEEVAKTAGYTYALIGAEYLNIRSDASEDGEILDTVGQSANLEILETNGDWVKVVTDDGIYGYVSSAYVSAQTAYSTGETVQERSEREEQEYLEAAAQQEAEYAAYVAEQEAAAAAQTYTDATAADAASTDTTYTDGTTYTDDATYTDDTTYTDGTTYTDDTTYTDTTAYTDDTTYTDTTTYTDETAYTDTTAASGDVDALYQAYLVAQDAAMTATDEADATAKANAAIEAYNAYLAACGSTQTVASVEAAPAAETTTDAGTTETAQAEAPQAEVYQEQTYQEETYQETTTAAEEPVSSSSGSGVGSEIASYALQFVGNPYVYGGTSLTNGADCSGFTMSVFANYGISLPHNAAAQSGCGTPVSLSDLQPGDLIFYGDGGIGHVAIYTGGGTVVHASNEETGIRTSAYNYRNPVAAVRVC